MIRVCVAVLGVLCASPATLQAQGAPDDRLARGGYAAIVNNQSSCTLAIDRANQPVPPNTTGMIFLSHDIFDAIREDGTMMREIPPRKVLVNGRAVAQADNTSYLEVWVSQACGVSVTQMRLAEMLAGVDARIQSLEAERAADRRGRIIGGTLAALSFGAAAYFSGSDSEEASSHAAISAGVGLGFLVGGFTLQQFDARDRDVLRLQQRFRRELTRSY